MPNYTLSAGDIVSGLDPEEHVEIRRITPFGSKTLVEGVGVTTKREIRRPLSHEDLARLAKVRGADYTYNGDAQAFLLGVEAHRIQLLDVLDSSDVIRQADEKLVIFTEHKDTLINLAERLTNKGYTVTTIHGGMDVDARKQAQREFRTRAKIMVATDAAGEGINLQFCRYLINWDIPWNPNRLEQRMGRIHRYGQRGDVWVYNLVATNTREGAVLSTVLKKLDRMREQMGRDRVYDVIDELLEDVPLVHPIERSIDEIDAHQAVKETEQHLRDEVMRQKADNLITLQQKRSLTSMLDLQSAKALRDESVERPCNPTSFSDSSCRPIRLLAAP